MCVREKDESVSARGGMRGGERFWEHLWDVEKNSELNHLCEIKTLQRVENPTVVQIGSYYKYVSEWLNEMLLRMHQNIVKLYIS